VYVPDLKSLVTKNGKVMQKVENGMVWVSSESLKVTENSNIHRAHTSFCYRPIVTMSPSCTVFEILQGIARKYQTLTYCTPAFSAPVGVISVEFHQDI